MLLLWNDKETAIALAEKQFRDANRKITPQRLQYLTYHITGSMEEAESAKCSLYHHNYQSSNDHV